MHLVENPNTYLTAQIEKFHPPHLSAFTFDIAAKRRKKHKNQNSRLVNSMRYNEQKSKIRLFTNPSALSSYLDLERVGDFHMQGT